MIRHLIFLFFVAIVAIIGLNIYLQPNDLKDCDNKPGVSNYCQPVDAIVAISGGDTEARVDEAIALYKNGWSKTLIFSGAAEDKTGPSNAAVMKTRAIKSGIPKSAIYLDERSETTNQNADNVQIIFSDHNIKSAILVTSGYHQRRASLEFKKSAPDVSILNHPAQNDRNWSIYWWMTPYGWWLTTGEVAKIVAFYLALIW